MLFNSYSFIFYFLIPVVIIYQFIPYRFRLWYLILVSTIFYAQWDKVHLFILLSSITINYLWAYILSKSKKYKKVLLVLIIGFNIGLLGYFKYSKFLNLREDNIVLPLAISFFTFQQIAYIVDIYKKKIVLEPFNRYLFFIMFFPQLVAGPIVHYSGMMREVDRGGLKGFHSNRFNAGVVLFSMGLFAKVVLADSLIKDSYNSWSDIFGYSFMIYFDFSGYSNMAIGLALMFGIALPINFNSPYKARNIIEFWRRWHITLSNFLKEHIYIPLGGNRYGKFREIVALMSTMIIGGIWHGAGWNFIFWGVGHGIGLVILHIFKFTNIKIPKILGVTLTFLYVSLLWVLFFSNSIEEALNTYKILFNFSEFKFNTYTIWLIFSAIVIWIMPNSMEIIYMRKENSITKYRYAYLSALLLFISLKFMAEAPSLTFVYFNF